MSLSRERKTRRPLVVWLDDHIEFYVEQIGHLNMRGFDVEATRSVTEFLTALQDQEINVAIIDIGLGEVDDGRVLIDLLYKTRPEVGIIVHSGHRNKFNPARYDTDRVCFIGKDDGHDPVAPSDAWPLADAVTRLVAALNERRVGQKSLGNDERDSRRYRFDWATVQRIREFAVEHFLLAVVIALLLIKIVALDPKRNLSFETFVEYLTEVAGFVVPFVIAVLLAAWFTPRRLREASSPEKFVQMYFEEANADDDFRATINMEVTRAGKSVPPGEFAALLAYYDVLATRRLWLARLVLAVFVLGVGYLIYDTLHDVIHLAYSHE